MKRLHRWLTLEKGWFWAVEYIPGSAVYIFYLGIFSVTWTKFDKMPRWGGWNID